MRTTDKKTLVRLPARMFSVAFAALLGSAFAQNAGWTPGPASDGTTSMLDAGLEVTAADGGDDGVGMASLTPSSLAEEAGVSGVAFDGGTAIGAYGGAGAVGVPVAQPGAGMQGVEAAGVSGAGFDGGTTIEGYGGAGVVGASPDGGVLEQPAQEPRTPDGSWQQR